MSKTLGDYLIKGRLTGKVFLDREREDRPYSVISIISKTLGENSTHMMIEYLLERKSKYLNLANHLDDPVVETPKEQIKYRPTTALYARGDIVPRDMRKLPRVKGPGTTDPLF
jgi:hypothetical protein